MSTNIVHSLHLHQKPRRKDTELSMLYIHLELYSQLHHHMDCKYQ